MPWDIIARNTATDRFNAVILPWHAAIPEKSIWKTGSARDATLVIFPEMPRRTTDPGILELARRGPRTPIDSINREIGGF